MKGELQRFSRRELANVIAFSDSDEFKSTVVMLKLMQNALIHEIREHAAAAAAGRERARPAGPDTESPEQGAAPTDKALSEPQGAEHVATGVVEGFVDGRQRRGQDARRPGGGGQEGPDSLKARERLEGWSAEGRSVEVQEEVARAVQHLLQHALSDALCEQQERTEAAVARRLEEALAELAGQQQAAALAQQDQMRRGFAVVTAAVNNLHRLLHHQHHLSGLRLDQPGEDDAARHQAAQAPLLVAHDPAPRTRQTPARPAMSPPERPQKVYDLVRVPSLNGGRADASAAVEGLLPAQTPATAMRPGSALRAGRGKSKIARHQHTKPLDFESPRARVPDSTAFATPRGSARQPPAFCTPAAAELGAPAPGAGEAAVVDGVEWEGPGGQRTPVPRGGVMQSRHGADAAISAEVVGVSQGASPFDPVTPAAASVPRLETHHSDTGEYGEMQESESNAWFEALRNKL